MLTVIVPTGRFLNFIFYFALSFVLIAVNLAKFSVSVNPAFVKVQVESVICYLVLNLYLESSN